MKKILTLLTSVFLMTTWISIAHSENASEAPDSAAQLSSAEEMARALQDPLANLAVIMTDNDILFSTGNDKESYSFQLQPVYSFDFPDEGFTFIPRAIVPIIGAAPFSDIPRLGPQRGAANGTVWGLSDIVTQFFFAPKIGGSWKFGIGPQFSWKTRTNSMLAGAGWGAGPVAVVTGGLGQSITVAMIAGNGWSYDGNFSLMFLQPLIFYNFSFWPGSYIGYNAQIVADWKENWDNTWTVPVGAVVGKTFDIGKGFGFDFLVGSYWTAVKPAGGADWSIKFGMSLIIPKM